MEQTIIEIPQDGEDGAWQPPILRSAGEHAEESPRRRQSCADVIFFQYALCILLVTAVFVIRYFDAALSDAIVIQFREHTQAPTSSAVEQVIAFTESQWS